MIAVGSEGQVDHRDRHVGAPHIGNQDLTQRCGLGRHQTHGDGSFDGGPVPTGGHDPGRSTVDGPQLGMVAHGTSAFGSQSDADAIAAEQHAIRSRIETIFRGPGSPAREALRMAVLDFRLEDTE